MEEGDNSRRRITIISCGELVRESGEKVLLVFDLISGSVRKLLLQ
jgi:hypothetical protein